LSGIDEFVEQTKSWLCSLLVRTQQR